MGIYMYVPVELEYVLYVKCIHLRTCSIYRTCIAMVVKSLVYICGVRCSVGVVSVHETKMVPCNNVMV